MHDVDGVNAGYARLLLDEYLENPEAVLPEWRALFESGDADIVASLPGLARLLEKLPQQRWRRQRPCAGRRLPACLTGSRPGAARRRRGRRRRWCKRAPHARPPRGAARSARLRACRRSGPRSAAPGPQADGRAPGTRAGVRAARPRPGRDARRRSAAAAGDLLRHDGLRDRAHRQPRAAGLVAPGDRVVAVSPAPLDRRTAPPVHAALPGRGVRAATFGARSSARSSSRSRASTF